MTTPEIILLDLEREALFGFQHTVCVETLEGMVEHLEQGGLLPPIPVRRSIIRGIYYMCPDIKNYASSRNGLLMGTDGGHTRSVAHYITGKIMRAYIVKEEYTYRMGRVDWKLVRELEII